MLKKLKALALSFFNQTILVANETFYSLLHAVSSSFLLHDRCGQYNMFSAVYQLNNKLYIEQGMIWMLTFHFED